jgi:GTPase SAR1 family protein
MALEVTREGAVPPASYDRIFKDNRPVVLTGQSGVGKTTTMKELLSEWTGNVFILDVRDEYQEFREIDLGRFFSLKWERENQRIRFVPNANKEASQGEASAIFSHLIFVMGTRALKSWVIVTEEAHRFGQDLNLRTLLIEARKFTRKLLIVTTDWRGYADIAQVYKPKPWEIA